MRKQIVESQQIGEGHRPSFAFNKVPTRVGWGTIANDKLGGIINPVDIDAGTGGVGLAKKYKTDRRRYAAWWLITETFG